MIPTICHTRKSKMMEKVKSLVFKGQRKGGMTTWSTEDF